MDTAWQSSEKQAAHPHASNHRPEVDWHSKSIAEKDSRELDTHQHFVLRLYFIERRAVLALLILFFKIKEWLRCRCKRFMLNSFTRTVLRMSVFVRIVFFSLTEVSQELERRKTRKRSFSTWHMLPPPTKEERTTTFPWVFPFLVSLI